MVMERRAKKRPLPCALPSTSCSTFFRDSTSNATPFHGKHFVLEIENKKDCEMLSQEIRKLGGNLANTISEEILPSCVISDHKYSDRLQRLTAKGNMECPPELLRSVPLLLRQAISMNIRIRSVHNFTDVLTNLKNRLRSTRKVMLAPVKNKCNPQQGRSCDSYLKLEDHRGMHLPLFKEYRENTHTLYLGKDMGRSLFHKATQQRSDKTKDEKNHINNPKNGFCEICMKRYDNEKEHFLSRQHSMQVSLPGFYDKVDALCGSYLDFLPHENRRSRLRPSPPSTPSQSM